MYFILVLSLLFGYVVIDTGRINRISKSGDRKSKRSKTPPRKALKNIVEEAAKPPAEPEAARPSAESSAEVSAKPAAKTSAEPSAEVSAKPAAKRNQYLYPNINDSAVMEVLNAAVANKLQLRYNLNRTTGLVKWRVCSNMDLKHKYANVKAHVKGTIIQPATDGKVRNPLREWEKVPFELCEDGFDELRVFCLWSNVDVHNICKQIKQMLPKERRKVVIPKLVEQRKKREEEKTKEQKRIEESRKRMEEKYVKQLESQIAHYKSIQAMVSLYIKKHTVDDINRIETTIINLRKEPACSTAFHVRTFKEDFDWCFHPEVVDKKESIIRQERQKTMLSLTRLDELKNKLLEERARRRKQEAERKRMEAKLRMERSTPSQTYIGKPPPIKKAVRIVSETYNDRVAREMEQRRLKINILQAKKGYKKL